VVLCPGINDGEILNRTIEDLYGRGEWILSLSVVPVGLTNYNHDRGGRQLSETESARALTQIDGIRARALDERGHGWCYAADELFLQAGAAVPRSRYYDDRELVGNGVGAMAELGDLIRADLPRLGGLDGCKLLLLTGTSMGPYLDVLGTEIAEASGARVDTIAIQNSLYGPLVTTAGLLAGRDYVEAARSRADADTVIFSRLALNAENLFLDDMSLAELQAALPDVDIWPSEHVTDVLIPA
jgi:NifB/MoaA-like Fe-S oxidoreductase